MTTTPPAPLHSESRESFSDRFAPRTTAGRELFCWCIGVQLLVLLLALAGSSAGREVRASVVSASDDLLVPIAEFSPSGESSLPESSPIREPAPDATPAARESLTELPEPVEAVAAEDVPTPDPAPADLLEPLPEPVIPPPRIQENPRSIPVVARMDPRPTGPASSERTSRPTPPAAATTNPSARTGSGGGNTGPAQLFSGGGSGRFPLPPYPLDAKRRGIEGRVMLRVAVGSDGTPGVPTIEISSGHSILDRAALDWIKRRWRWESGPPRLFRIPIIFRLQ